VPSEQHGATRGGGPDELATVLRPVVAEAVGALGFDLESIDVHTAGRRKLVKVVVDADDGVELDLLSEVSRKVSAVLDTRDDLLIGPYTLEVTSPGVDRPLTQPRHWRRARLRLVRVRPHEGVEFVCRVGNADDTGVEVLVAGALRRLEYRTVARAVVEIEFKQPPAAELLQLERGGRGGAADETVDGQDRANGPGQGTKEESR
jgi:ribosome maturation factor RimP